MSHPYTADDMDRALAVLMGQRLRTLRKQRYLSQGTIAAALGHANHTWVCNMERGRHAPTMQTLYRLADLFGCHPAAFLPSLAEVAAEAERIARERTHNMIPTQAREDS